MDRFGRRLMLCITVMLIGGLLPGCSQRREEPSPRPEPEPRPAEPAGDEAPATPDAAPVQPNEPQPAAQDAGAAPELIDLLHAVPAEVAVSTAYRDELTQVGRLCDGNLLTAWNSATGNLQGAWISIRLPETATVSFIEMTVGYTKVDRGRDLFTSNQRVQRVRVSRDGAELGSFPLDIVSQELQRLPVSGSGGEYRIELTEIVVGSRPTWREACVSEIRVMGTAPGAVAGASTPTFRIEPAGESDAGPDAATADAGGPTSPEPDAGAGAETEPEDEGPPPTAPPAPPAPPELHEADGIRLTSLEIGSAVEGGRAIDSRRVYFRESDDRVYCMFRMENTTGAATQVYLQWQTGDQPASDRGREFGDTRRPRFSAYAYTRADRDPGTYSCVMRSAQGSLLGRIEFEIQ